MVKGERKYLEETQVHVICEGSVLKNLNLLLTIFISFLTGHLHGSKQRETGYP